jgi:hypothetical protein
VALSLPKGKGKESKNFPSLKERKINSLSAFLSQKQGKKRQKKFLFCVSCCRRYS